MPVREIDDIIIDGVECDDFTNGYITAAFWSSTEGDDTPLDDLKTWNDLEPESLQRMVADCQKFQKDNAADLVETYRADHLNGIDFWLTRNGHGAGFWDGDLSKQLGERLTTAAHLGERSLIIGDDGRVYEEHG